MKLHIRSFKYDELPENYLKVIEKYAKNGNIELVRDDEVETDIAIIEVDSLEILPKFENDIREARGIIQSWDFEDIHGLIFNTLDEKEKVYQVDIYDSYIE